MFYCSWFAKVQGMYFLWVTQRNEPLFSLDRAIRTYSIFGRHAPANGFMASASPLPGCILPRFGASNNFRLEPWFVFTP
jgi:hypothetical protein